jgi:hypothetical protein
MWEKFVLVIFPVSTSSPVQRISMRMRFSP